MSFISKLFKSKEKEAGKGPVKKIDADDKFPSPRMKTTVWTIGGGKGGVGKSMVVSNLAALLSRQGKRVLLVDADLGAANLHTLVGADNCRYSISSFIKSDLTDVGPIVSSTRIPNVGLISGVNDSLDIANLNGDKISRFRKALRRADYDYVLLDIGPGTSNNMLDFFLMADQGVLVSTPEPTSIENTYRFIKCLYLRRMKVVIDSNDGSRLRTLIHKVLYDTHGPRTIAGIIQSLKSLDNEQGEILRALLGKVRISVVINQAKNTDDREIGHTIKRACFDFFGLDVGFVGRVSYDDAVGDSIRTRKPLVIGYNHTTASKELESVFNALYCG